MEIDIGNYIGSLLYENKTVALPGLGSFETTYQPAVIDQVQGELHPPGKNIAFNPNLVGDDGLLAGAIEKQSGLSSNDAAEMLREYIEEMKEAIDRREIVVFSKVGRLYKDYENNLQFLPDGNNYDVNSFGLPTLNFYPVARSNAGEAAPKKKTARVAAPIGTGQATNNGLIAVIAAATVVVGIAVYFLVFGAGEGTEKSMQPVPTSRVNIHPGDKAADSGSSHNTDTTEQLQDSDSPDMEINDADTEKPTPVPGQQSYVIIVGVFGNPDNVKKLIDDIYDAGYEPYTEKSGSLTKVGVQRTYRSEAEIEAAIKDVRNRFARDAKLYRW